MLTAGVMVSVPSAIELDEAAFDDDFELDRPVLDDDVELDIPILDELFELDTAELELLTAGAASVLKPLEVVPILPAASFAWMEIE